MSKPLFLSTALVDKIQYWLEPLKERNAKAARILKLEAYWKVGELLSVNKVRTSHKCRFKHLSEQLTASLGYSISVGLLLDCHNFYKSFSEWNDVHPEMSWSHYRQLLQIKGKRKRDFYNKVTARHHWNAKQLSRQIKAHYYERSRIQKGKSTTAVNPANLIKDLYILEFLNMADQNNFLEKELEDGLVEKLQYFLMELGEGFAFVARQKRIVTATGKQFYVDLVFYHFRLKCFVLFELKVGALSHRDIGQLDMYVRLFDKKWKSDMDNPTIGIVLCSEKDPTIVQYSVLQNSQQLHAAQYRFKAETTKVEARVQAALERMFGKTK